MKRRGFNTATEAGYTADELQAEVTLKLTVIELATLMAAAGEVLENVQDSDLASALAKMTEMRVFPLALPKGDLQ